jgi:DNA-binding MarR family transcriptional regulator
MRRRAVAWAPKFVHVRAMTGQSAIASHIRIKTNPATSGERAPLKLEQFLPYQLTVVAALVSQALAQVYTSRYRIGIPEWRVLVTLGQFGVMTGKAIGTHTHMHKTKVSRAVALLEKRRLLARRANPADMRESFISLTTAGRTIYEELAPHALDFARRLTDILTPDDRDAFNRALQQIADRSAKLVAETAKPDGDMGAM